MPVFEQHLQPDQDFRAQLHTPAGVVLVRVKPCGHLAELKLLIITPPGLEVEPIDAPLNILPFTAPPLPPLWPAPPPRAG